MGVGRLHGLAINEVLPKKLLGIPRSAGVSWHGRLGAASGGSASSRGPTGDISSPKALGCAQRANSEHFKVVGGIECVLKQ
jgi:hypothetical protein